MNGVFEPLYETVRSRILLSEKEMGNLWICIPLSLPVTPLLPVDPLGHLEGQLATDTSAGAATVVGFCLVCPCGQVPYIRYSLDRITSQERRGKDLKF